MTPSEQDSMLSPAQVRAYHLGQLTDDEVDAIEARYFADRDAFDLVDAAADALVDEYLDGQLSGDERARTETLLATPEWTSRLRFATALRAVVQEQAGGEQVARWTPFAVFRGMSAWQWGGGLLAAAALVFAVTGSVAVRNQLEGVTAQLEETRGERDRALTEARESAARVDDERTTREALARRLESLTSIAVMLMPGTRSDGAAVVRVPADAALVRLTAVQDDPLPSGIVSARFEVRRGDVQVAGGTIALESINARDGTIEVQVPAAALSPGEFELRIAVAMGQRQFVDFSTHTFFVRR